MPSEASPKPAAPERALIVLRIGEIFLKGGNRQRFFNAFVGRARELVADLPGVVVSPRHLRVWVRAPLAQRDAAIARLKRLFGLQTMSPAVAIEPTLEAMKAEALALARALPAGTRFKVETNRRDKTFPLTSLAISKEVGGYVDDHADLVVDVRTPEVTLKVEVGEGESCVFSETIAGPGGLPIGTGGRATLLLSGGIDSPVAGWSVMRRGVEISAVYYHSFPFTGDKSKEKVLDLARLMARWHGPMRVRVLHFTEIQKQLRAAAPGELAVLMYRRMMMRAASLIARGEGASALVTGENLGQVASQTIENLGVIEDAASLPVLRPLLCYDKTEIIARAEAIGTFETSILPYDDCCSLFVPKHPATRARVRDLVAGEAGLDVDAMARSLADNAEIHEIDV